HRHQIELVCQPAVIDPVVLGAQPVDLTTTGSYVLITQSARPGDLHLGLVLDPEPLLTALGPALIGRVDRTGGSGDRGRERETQPPVPADEIEQRFHGYQGASRSRGPAARGSPGGRITR